MTAVCAGCQGHKKTTRGVLCKRCSACAARWAPGRIERARTATATAEVRAAKSRGVMVYWARLAGVDITGLSDAQLADYATYRRNKFTYAEAFEAVTASRKVAA